MHGHERGAEAFDAGEVLVAAGLVDRALAPELGLERLHRYAVRDDAAVAAALADELVDDHALVGIKKSAALAPTTFLSRAGLVGDQHRPAQNCGKLHLQPIGLGGMMTGEDLGPVLAGRVFVRLVGDTTTRFAPSAATWRAICGTVRPPSLAWPPVIATASLNRIL